jgi:hypothetical protein
MIVGVCRAAGLGIREPGWLTGAACGTLLAQGGLIHRRLLSLTLGDEERIAARSHHINGAEAPEDQAVELTVDGNILLKARCSDRRAVLAD